MFSYQKRNHIGKTADFLFMLKDLVRNKKNKWMYVLVVVPLYLNVEQTYIPFVEM